MTVWLTHIYGVAVDEYVLSNGESYPVAKDTHLVDVFGSWKDVREYLNAWIERVRPIVDRYDPNIHQGVAHGVTDMERLVVGFPSEGTISCCFGLPGRFWVVFSKEGL